MAHSLSAGLLSPREKDSGPAAVPKKPALNILAESRPAPGAECFANTAGDPLTDAFSRKAAVHAGMDGTPLDKAAVPEMVQRLQGTPRKGPAAAYVHLPYCENKCLYCGFFGGKYSEDAGAAYLETLIREIESERDRPSVASAPINALYLGGGTPTALRPRELTRLLRVLRSALPLANDCEITVEGRVHNLDAEKMEACLEGGANRFSIGVQSFHTEIRRRLGRFSTGEEVRRRLEFLASYNQAAIIVDLIYGLPGQGLKEWEDDIRAFLSLPLDGVDLYQLNIFSGSALARSIRAGSLPETASLAEQGRFFERGLALMEGARCRRLSLSHWARTSRERNLYNPMAKRRTDCLHYGAGAGGSLQGWFMFNDPNVEQYLRRCTGGEKPVAMLAAPPDDLELTRSILGQLEHCRLNLDDLNAALARTARDLPAADDLFAPLLDNWEEAGLIARDGPWVELTTAGQFWQVNLAQALIDWRRRVSKEMA
ncbi:MAG: heme anaerobic degradation radical SAM methyltransferase ChuW/HutW [Deltaproteobacteria bacterium]|jgi:oxygen-independent coproporphyrinogen-3 oxidase|nr:heme anaerobic degradation radical SAM methyltransferase ChuW/HutW [Deltaproteobacteria bacterium]